MTDTEKIERVRVMSGLSAEEMPDASLLSILTLPPKKSLTDVIHPHMTQALWQFLTGMPECNATLRFTILLSAVATLSQSIRKGMSQGSSILRNPSLNK